MVELTNLIAQIRAQFADRSSYDDLRRTVCDRLEQHLKLGDVMDLGPEDGIYVDLHLSDLSRDRMSRVGGTGSVTWIFHIREDGVQLVDYHAREGA